MMEPSQIKLTELSEKLNASSSPEEKREILTHAFESYTLETAKLEKAHAELINKFELLKKEFTETNLYLKIKLDELDAVNDYLNSLIYNMSQGLIFIDLRGNVTTYNRTAAEILQIPIAKVLFNSYWESFSDDFFGFSMKEALLNKNILRTSYLTLAQEGKIKELGIDTTYVLQNDPPEGAADFQGMIILIRDLTEIRRLEALQSRNDRMKELGEMAAKVAHEIRNPLGGIKGFASLLERDLQDRPEQQQMAGYIVEGTDNLNNLVTNVLNYSRPVKPQFESADFIPFLRDTFHYIQADTNTPKNIELKLDLSPDSLTTVFDPQLMKGAILNLALNGIQAMPHGGTLAITTKEDKGNIIIKVSDTGVGISPQNLTKIFSPLFTTKPKGNGFGLSEVFKVIEAHHGTIEVESTVDVGTTFTVQIPIGSKYTESES
jgi:signal transduction histidine kinase